MATSGKPEIYYATELLGSAVLVGFGVAALRLPSLEVSSFTTHQMAVVAIVAAVVSGIATVQRERRLQVEKQPSVPAQYVTAAVPEKRPNAEAKAAKRRFALRRSAFRTAFMSRPSVRSAAPVQTINS